MVDQIVCNSSAVVASLGGGKLHREIPHIIPPPIAPGIDRLPLEPGRDAATFTVVGCGRLSPEKDWSTLLRGFAAFRPAGGASVRLVLIGDGPLREPLAKLGKQLNLNGDLEMRGRVAYEDVLTTLRTAALSVLPSRFEGLGMAAIEAMQCGVPTITADFEASYDFLDDGVTGHRFPRGDWRALSDLMLWHYRNRDESKAIGKSGRESVLELFSEENTFAKYLPLYGIPPQPNLAPAT